MEKTYIAYLRQSTQKQEMSGLGVEAQRAIIESHIKEGEIICEYVETETGKKSDRPELLKALEHCKKVNAVLVVAKLDRLSRNVAFMSRLLESDTEILFCDFPSANRLILHIISSISEYEATLISTRTKQALTAKKNRGAKLGNPDNLLQNHQKAIQHSVSTSKRKAKENPNNMRAVAMIKSMYNEGKSFVQMAKYLNEQGFCSSRGGKFQTTQVKRLFDKFC
ncbi:recombinase family protein [Alistipes sp. OttesenSCG-928-L06]|nr:recombinase family protein [Alistipes sp. OttesenSCG-928-L06]